MSFHITHYMYRAICSVRAHVHFILRIIHAYISYHISHTYTFHITYHICTHFIWTSHTYTRRATVRWKNQKCNCNMKFCSIHYRATIIWNSVTWNSVIWNSVMKFSTATVRWSSQKSALWSPHEILKSQRQFAKFSEISTIVNSYSTFDRKLAFQNFVFACAFHVTCHIK